VNSNLQKSYTIIEIMARAASTCLETVVNSRSRTLSPIILH